jgi:hypothetical protein
MNEDIALPFDLPAVAGSCFISTQPQPDAGELDYRDEACGELVVAGGDTSEMLEFVEEALDAVATISTPFLPPAACW